LAAVVSLPAAVQAHFKLIEPASWIVEDQRGDPQKQAPCGGDAKQQTASNTIDKAVGGSKIHLKVQETIFHPGHYRVALAINSREELPTDPMTIERMTERGPQSVWAAIQSPVQAPIIADGLFQHYDRPVATTPPTPLAFETDVTLPNVTCAKCTLQIIQFMANHGYNMPGGYSYHHCADIAITADPAKPFDTRFPAAKS
jgi:hypothetical protein